MSPVDEKGLGLLTQFSLSAYTTRSGGGEGEGRHRGKVEAYSVARILSLGISDAICNRFCDR
jgi:hypothetical protein